MTYLAYGLLTSLTIGDKFIKYMLAVYLF